eukprot:gene1607-446_t
MLRGIFLVILPCALAIPGRPWPDTSDGISVFADEVCHATSMDQYPNLVKWVANHYVGTQKAFRSVADALRKVNPGFLLPVVAGLCAAQRCPLLPVPRCVGPGRSVTGTGPRAASPRHRRRYNVTNKVDCSWTQQCIGIVVNNSYVCEWPGDDVIKPEWLAQVTDSDPSTYVDCPSGDQHRCPPDHPVCAPGPDPGLVRCISNTSSLAIQHASPAGGAVAPVSCSEVDPDSPGQYCATGVFEPMVQCDQSNYMMNVSVDTYRQWWTNMVIEQIAINDNDGLFGDSCSMPEVYGSHGWKPPIPVPDIPMEHFWYQAIDGHMANARAKMAPHGYKLVVNVGSWDTTRDQTNYSIAGNHGHTDGIMIESGLGILLEKGDVVDFVMVFDRVLPLTNNGKILLLQPYDTSSEYIRMLNLATYLFAKGPYSYFSYGGGCYWYPEFDIPIGSPTVTKAWMLWLNIRYAHVGSRRLSAHMAVACCPNTASQDTLKGYQVDGHTGVYARRFSNGIAYINTGDSPVTVLVPQPVAVSHPSGGGPIPDDTCHDESCGIPDTWLMTYEKMSTSIAVPAKGGAVVLFNPPAPPAALTCSQHKASAAHPAMFCDVSIPEDYISCPTAERFSCPHGYVCHPGNASRTVNCGPNATAAMAPAVPVPPSTHQGPACSPITLSSPGFFCVEGNTSAYETCANGTKTAQSGCPYGYCHSFADRQVDCLWVLPEVPVPLANAVNMSLYQTAWANDSRLVLSNGRWVHNVSAKGTPTASCGWSGCTVDLEFSGTRTLGLLPDGGLEGYIIVDGDEQTMYEISTPHLLRNNYTFGVNFTTGQHMVRLYIKGEGGGSLSGMFIDKGGKFLNAAKPPTRRMACIGDSISCGYGDECSMWPEQPNPSSTSQWENSHRSWCPMLARNFSAEYHLLCSVLQDFLGSFLMPQFFCLLHACGSMPTDLGKYPLYPVFPGTNDWSTPGKDQDAADWISKYVVFIKDIKMHWPATKVVVMCGPMICDSCWGNSHGCCTAIEQVAQKAEAAYVHMDCHNYEGPGMSGCAGHPSVLGHYQMTHQLYPAVQNLTHWD